MTDEKITRLSEVKLPPHEAVIESLELALKDARSGKARGVLILINTQEGTEHHAAGIWDGPAILWALENWKHRFLHKHQKGL